MMNGFESSIVEFSTLVKEYLEISQNNSFKTSMSASSLETDYKEKDYFDNLFEKVVKMIRILTAYIDVESLNETRIDPKGKINF